MMDLILGMLGFSLSLTGSVANASGTPPNVILDENGAAILDESGVFILEDV